MMLLSRLPDAVEPASDSLMITSSVQSGAVQLPEMADTEHFQFSDRGFEPIVVESMEIRLARTPEEVLASQRLRYEVFYEEMGATPIRQMAELRRDYDAYDRYCDHLLVFDRRRPEGAQVVGTYRLITRDVAKQMGQFYSASEYDISKILDYPGELLEFGRSCVMRSYRTFPVMQLLWRGIAAYIFTHQVEMMFGVASFPGQDVQALREPLSFLYHHHLAPIEQRAVCLPQHYVDMNLLPSDQVHTKSVMNKLPPLIKGYLRVGAWVGDGAYIDRQWNSVDVFILVKTDKITPKYMEHYGLSGVVNDSLLPE